MQQENVEICRQNSRDIILLSSFTPNYRNSKQTFKILLLVNRQRLTKIKLAVSGSQIFVVIRIEEDRPLNWFKELSVFTAFHILHTGTRLVFYSTSTKKAADSIAVKVECRLTITSIFCCGSWNPWTVNLRSTENEVQTNILLNHILLHPIFISSHETIIALQWRECRVCVNVSNTFKGEQRPLQRAQCSGLISGVDLLEEAICVVAPEGACKAVDAWCQL